MSDPDRAPAGEHLERSLTNRHIQLIAIGGAIGTGLFMGSGKTISVAGPSLLIVYLIIGVMLFFVMRAMGEILLHNLDYKSFQDFAHDLIGPWAGFFAGWTYWILWVVTATAELIVIIGYFDFWIGNMHLSMICGALLLLALVGSNLLTVKLFGEIEFWFALIKIIAIIVLIVAGIWMIVTGFVATDGTPASITYLWDRNGVFPNGLNGFLQAFQIAIFAFIGIELIGTTAAETADPHKTLPKAINAIPVRIVVFYVLSLAVIMSVTPWDHVNPEVSPFVNLFTLVGLTAAAGIMNFVVLTSASSSSNSGIFSTSRMLYGLAQSKHAPKSLGELSSRKVPAKALIVSVILVCSAFPLLAIGGNVLKAFELVSTVAAVLILFMWSIIMVSYIQYRKRFPEAHAKAAFRMPGASFMPWVVLAFFGFVTFVLGWSKETRTALVLTPLWFIGLGIVWMIKKKSTPSEGKGILPTLKN